MDERALELESLSGFLVDLPGGAHAVVRLAFADVAGALERCREVAEEQTERFVLAEGPDHDVPAGPVLAAVDADAAIDRLGFRGHLQAEVHATAPPPGARLVCIYTDDVLDEAPPGVAERLRGLHPMSFPPRWPD